MQHRDHASFSLGELVDAVLKLPVTLEEAWQRITRTGTG